MPLRLLTVCLPLLLVLSGCSRGIDHQTLEIAESLPVANLELESAERTDRLAIPGKPDSGFATYAEITQIYAVPNNDPTPVLAELMELVVAAGWEIETAYPAGHFRTSEQIVEGRRFSLVSGAPPDGSTVSLRLEETRRDTLPQGDS